MGEQKHNAVLYLRVERFIREVKPCCYLGFECGVFAISRKPLIYISDT